MKHVMISFAFGSALALVGQPIFASTINITFSGVVRSASLQFDNSVTPGGVAGGETVTGTISYDAADYSIGTGLDPTISRYIGTGSVALTVDGQAYSADLTDIEVRDGGANTLDEVRLRFSNTSPTVSVPGYINAGAPGGSFTFTQTSLGSESLVESNALPTTASELNLSAGGSGVLGNFVRNENNPSVVDAYNILLDIDDVAVNDDTTEQSQAKAAIYVDFDDPYVLTSEVTFTTVSETANSTVESRTVSRDVLVRDDQKSVDIDRVRVIQELEAILSRSELKIDVVTDATELQNYETYIRARFDPDGDGDAGLGEARDIRLDTSLSDGLGYLVTSLDRFDKRKDGTVDIYFDNSTRGETSDVVASLAAATIAHEAGHGFGLRHIEGVSVNSGDSSFSKDVMDYDFYPSVPETFADQVYDAATITGDLNNANYLTGFAASFATHNPQYHLRRYALAEDVSSYQAGNYDDQLFENVFSSVSLSLPTISSDQGTTWYLEYVDQESGFGDHSTLIDLSDYFENGELRLLIDPLARFRVLGTDGSNEILDYILGNFSEDGLFRDVLTAVDFTSNDVEIGWYDQLSGNIDFFSSAEISSRSHYTYADSGFSKHSVAPVPLPAGFLFLITGLLAVSATRFRLTKKQTSSSKTYDQNASSGNCKKQPKYC